MLTVLIYNEHYLRLRKLYLPKSIHLIVHHICICGHVYRHTHTHTPRRTKCSSEEELLDETEGNYT